MQKVSITIDLSKIDKNRIIERTYETRDGEKVTAKEYKMDVVPMKPENHKTITSGEGWAMVKNHFVADTPTKEERANQSKTQYLGEGFTFQDMTGNTAPTAEDTPF